MRHFTILLAAFFIGGSGTAYSQARKPIKSLKDIELLVSATGDWEGVGIGFDIVKGELKEPQSFRDDWGADFKKGDQVFEMVGLITRSGSELPYSWKFNFNGNAENITASYEMGTDQSGVLAVKVIAGGKRLQLGPVPGKQGINMKIDIYFEEGDIVIESEVRNITDELVYRSATRYQKISS